MTNVKETLVTDQRTLEAGDRVRVEFEGVVEDVGRQRLSGVVINHGDNHEYTSEVFLGVQEAHASPTNVTVTKLVEVPEFEVGQVWRANEYTFVVYFASVPREPRILDVSYGTIYKTDDFARSYPEAELILDA